MFSNFFLSSGSNGCLCNSHCCCQVADGWTGRHHVFSSFMLPSLYMQCHNCWLISIDFFAGDHVQLPRTQQVLSMLKKKHKKGEKINGGNIISFNFSYRKLLMWFLKHLLHFVFLKWKTASINMFNPLVHSVR